MNHQHLIHQLESGQLETRREAARALAQIPSMGAIMERDERDISHAIGPLAVALFDEDAEVRKYAARAIGGARRDGQDISAAIPALVRALADARPDIRRSVTLIVRGGVVQGWDIAPFLTQLCALLEDPVPEVRWGSADALAYHFAATKQWDRVADLLKHADPDVSQETAGTLAAFYFRLDYRPVVPELLSLLSAESLELRLVAARAVVCRSRRSADIAAAIPVLLDSLSSEEARIRKSSVQALESAIAGVFRHHPQIREHAKLDSGHWESLAPGTMALPALEQALSDPHDAIQAAAIGAFSTFLAALPAAELDRYDGIIRLLTKRLRSRSADVKRAAAKALTRQWVRSGRWDALVALLTRRPKVVRRQVLAALATDETIRGLDFAPLVPTLLRLVSDPDGDLSYGGRHALERADVGELLSLLEADPLDTRARWELLQEVRGKVHRKLLKSLEDELKDRCAADRVARLNRLLTHEEPAVRGWAAESLEWIGRSQSIPGAILPLIQLLHDPDPAVQCAAASALGGAARHNAIGQAHEPLIQLISDESALVGELAFWTLERSADAGGDLGRVLPALGEVLRGDRDQASRERAAMVISAAAAAAGCNLGAFVPDLASALGDDSQRVCFYIARALHYAAEGGADIRETVPALLRVLRDRDRSSAAWASAALKAYATDAAGAALVLEGMQGLDHRSRRVAGVARFCERQLQEKGTR